MLSKRSIAVGSKQSLMSDHLSLPSPTPNYNNNPFASSPKPFFGFSDTDAAMSPTSILQTKHLSSLKNPFFADRHQWKPVPEFTPNAAREKAYHPWENGNSGPIGLGIVDALKDENSDERSPKKDARMVLFGSQLRIQIPSINTISTSPSGSADSPCSPVEFGVKSKNSQQALSSPSGRSLMKNGSVCSELVASSPKVLLRSLSAKEVELSEDYTRVIARGPNPRTTHIFDNCIIESRGDGFVASGKEDGLSDDFLSSCCACKKSLGQGEDTFMYRGEKAFCSHECRSEAMLFDDEGSQKSFINSSVNL